MATQKNSPKHETDVFFDLEVVLMASERNSHLMSEFWEFRWIARAGKLKWTWSAIVPKLKWQSSRCLPHTLERLHWASREEFLFVFSSLSLPIHFTLKHHQRARLCYFWNFIFICSLFLCSSPFPSVISQYVFKGLSFTIALIKNCHDAISMLDLNDCVRDFLLPPSLFVLLLWSRIMRNNKRRQKEFSINYKLIMATFTWKNRISSSYQLVKSC